MTISALPNKYMPISQSLIGIASLLIEKTGENDTVSSLWEKVKKDEKIRTFDRYAEALTLLYAGGIIKLDNGVLALKRNET